MSKKKEKPLTRSDVLKMIKKHGGPEGLDLSGRNLEGIDLSPGWVCANGMGFIPPGKPPIDLHGIILEWANLKGAHLDYANLQGARLAEAYMQGASLFSAKLQDAILFKARLQQSFLSDANLCGSSLMSAELQGAVLWSTDLQGAILEYADLQGAQLKDANLRDTNLMYATLHLAYLDGISIDSNTRLQNVDWGPDYIVGEEKEACFKAAESIYRSLKQWHTEAGMYELAGKFFFREMEVRRKAICSPPPPKALPEAPSTTKTRYQWGKTLYQLQSIIYSKRVGTWLWLTIIKGLCGYGERPLNIVISAFIIVLVMAGIYTASALSFLQALYFSAISFTALGYGAWVSAPDRWVKALGAAEAFIGVFMMALFLITFVRKMTR
ncbi:hypothetical protein ES707_04727 [subsurface metagenome]